MKFGNLYEILDYAIREEEKSNHFYQDLSGRVTKKWIRDLMREFAAEELEHRSRLLDIKNGSRIIAQGQEVTDLGLAEVTESAEPSADMDYQDALILAMKMEKAAYKLYSDLAYSVEDKVLKVLFKALAREEAGHKLRFELEYDEHVLTEN
ncbi:MAG: ferritin family protein [Candidatus Wallbacteria bacterium]|nr:ferritin family protein [Candidatus Wallbacteria bacterium]